MPAGTRPASVDFELRRYTTDPAVYETVGTYTLTGTGDTWTYAVNNLDQTNPTGATYVYTVVEVGASGGNPSLYTAGSPVDNGNTLEITNTFEPSGNTTSYAVTKLWVDGGVSHTISEVGGLFTLYKSVNGSAPAAVVGASPSVTQDTGNAGSFTV